MKIKNKFEWKIMPNSPYGCEKYHHGGITVGSFTHTLMRDDPDGDYIGKVHLPGIKAKIKIHGTRENVKAEIERLVKSWFEYLNK